jgi:hypothetical protein
MRSATIAAHAVQTSSISCARASAISRSVRLGRGWTGTRRSPPGGGGIAGCDPEAGPSVRACAPVFRGWPVFVAGEGRDHRAPRGGTR